MRETFQWGAKIGAWAAAVVGGALTFSKALSAGLDFIGAPKKIGEAIVSIAAYAPYAVYGTFALGVVSLCFMFWDRFDRSRQVRTISKPETGTVVDNSAVGTILIAEMVQFVASAIDDKQADKCWPSARIAIRQAASDGDIALTGRKQLPQSRTLDGEHGFDKIWTAIPREYWASSTIGPIATSENHERDYHTFPASAFAWNNTGEMDRLYASLRMRRGDFDKWLRSLQKK